MLEADIQQRHSAGDERMPRTRRPSRPIPSQEQASRRNDQNANDQPGGPEISEFGRQRNRETEQLRVRNKDDTKA